MLQKMTSSVAAVLGVLAVVGGGIAYVATRPGDARADAAHKPTATHPASTTRPTAAPTSRTASLAPTHAPTHAPTVVRPKVVVFNNTPTAKLAATVAAKARAAGWTVAATGDWHGKIEASTVYYPKGMGGQAAVLAKSLGISRLKPKLGDMPADRLSVMVVKGYAG